MSLAIVLACKGFRADIAHEWPLVGVSAKVGTKIVCTCEFLGAEMALERGRVFLNAFLWPKCGRAAGVCELEDVVSIGDRIGGRATLLRSGSSTRR